MVTADRQWVQWALALIGVGASLWLYRDTLTYLGDLFSTVETYGHWWLVVAISVCLCFWIARQRRSEPGRPMLWTAVPLLLISLVWLVGELSSTMVLQVTFLPLLLLGIVALTTGAGTARVLAFPLLYLYFTIPVWSYLGPLLQEVTIIVVFRLCGLLFGFPAFLDGDIVNVPAGSFVISEGCSGLHYTIVASAIAVLAAYLYIAGTARQIAFVLIAVLFSIVSNWIRVAALILIGQTTDMQHFLIQESHVGFGWILFTIFVLAPLAIFLLRFANSGEEAELSSCAGPDKGRPKRWHVGAAAALLLVVGFGPALSALINANSAQQPGKSLPATVGEWSRIEVETPDWVPVIAGAMSSGPFEYRNANASVQMSMQFIPGQRQGAELIGATNAIVPSDEWQVLADNTREWRPSDLSMTVPREAIVTDPHGVRHAVWYWYEVGGRLANSNLSAKYWQVVGAVEGKKSAYVFALLSECKPDCNKAILCLDRFLAEIEKNEFEVLVVASRGREFG